MSDAADPYLSQSFKLNEEGKARLEKLLDEGLDSDPIVLDAAEWQRMRDEVFNRQNQVDADQ